MKVLVGCEESQAVTIEFRKLGIEAYSCDILPCSGGHPEWHFQEDIFDVIAREKFDMGIFFPPCTHLTVSGNKWFKPEFKERFPNKHSDREEAILFVKKIMDCGIPKIAIENPIGVLSTRIRKPDQIVQPYFFGDATPKSTCLWLFGLPKLIPTNIVKPEFIIGKRDGKKYSLIHYQTPNNKDRAKIRSKTFPGIAHAMATQWSNIQEPTIKTPKQLELFS